MRIIQTLGYMSICCASILLGLVLYSIILNKVKDYHHTNKDYVVYNSTTYHYSLFSCLNGVMILQYPKSKLVDINTNIALQCEIKQITDSQFVGELHYEKTR